MASRYGKARINMKNTFKILGAFTFLIALTIAFSAFKGQTEKARTLQYWEYIGSTDPTDQMQYQASSGPSCASGINEVCTILAEEDPNQLGYPLIIGEDVESRITNKDESSGNVFVRN
jgi:hypothetical protein